MEEIAGQWRKRDFSRLRAQVARLEGVTVEDLDGDGLFGEDPAQTLGETLEALDPKYPPSEPGIEGTIIPE